MFAASADVPNALLPEPLMLLVRALYPNALFRVPVVFEASA